MQELLRLRLDLSRIVKTQQNVFPTHRVGERSLSYLDRWRRSAIRLRTASTATKHLRKRG